MTTPHASRILGDQAVGKMDENTLLIGLITGSIGLGYFVYGKKQERFVAMISGAGLCVLPYCTGNIAAIIVISLVLLAAPFILRFWD